MDKMICKICGNELQKEGDSYICQKCGCEYTADLSGIVSFSPKDNGEIDTSKVIESVSGMWSCVPEFNSNADNQIYAKIVRIGHLNKEIHGQQIVDVFEDDVLSKYMEINQCGIREIEEAYMFDKSNLDKALKLIKKTFFDNKDKVIVDKTKKDIEEKGLF